MKRAAAVLIGAIAAACSGGGAGANEERAVPLLGFHLAAEQQGADVTPMDFEGRQVFVKQPAVIADPDILDVSAVQGDGGVILDVRLTPEGAEQMRRITGENIGRTIVILFNDRVVSTPVIQSEIAGRGQVQIPARSADEAREIIEKVRARWPSG